LLYSQCFVALAQTYLLYMEPVVLLRRTVIVVLNVSLVLSPRWKYTSFVLASLALLLVHVRLSPFRTQVCENPCLVFDDGLTVISCFVLSETTDAKPCPFCISWALPRC
jgi:hypothetical protein